MMNASFCASTQRSNGEPGRYPTGTVLAAIHEFDARQRIYMVRFRNNKGRYLDFAECFPDDGSVDMPACIRAYREVGYDGVCCRSRKKLVKQGVRDMVRISDARMSGTSSGACILHVSPESVIGGPLALVRTGDIIHRRSGAHHLPRGGCGRLSLRPVLGIYRPAGPFRRGRGERPMGRSRANEPVEETVSAAGPRWTGGNPACVNLAMTAPPHCQWQRRLSD